MNSSGFCEIGGRLKRSLTVCGAPGAVLLRGAWLLAACSVPGSNVDQDATHTHGRIVVQATPSWQRSSRTLHKPDGVPKALGAGNGAAGIVVSERCFSLILRLHAQPYVAGSIACDNRGPGNPLAGDRAPTDVVYVAPNATVWWLDAGTGTIVSENPAGYHRRIIRLPLRGRAIAACSSDGKVVAYVDSATPGVIAFVDTEAEDSSWSAALPNDLGFENPAAWRRARLGAVPGEPCVLVAPRVGSFVVVGRDSLFPAPFMVRQDRTLTGPQPRWIRLLRRFAPPTSVARPLDATSIAGGVAILLQGIPVPGGRLVDLYHENGNYWLSMLLPHAPERIASNGTELLALSRRGEHWIVAGFTVPRPVSGSSPDTATRDRPRGSK